MTTIKGNSKEDLVHIAIQATPCMLQIVEKEIDDFKIKHSEYLSPEISGILGCIEDTIVSIHTELESHKKKFYLNHDLEPASWILIQNGRATQVVAEFSTFVKLFQELSKPSDDGLPLPTRPPSEASGDKNSVYMKGYFDGLVVAKAPYTHSIRREVLGAYQRAMHKSSMEFYTSKDLSKSTRGVSLLLEEMMSSWKSIDELEKRLLILEREEKDAETPEGK